MELLLREELILAALIFVPLERILPVDRNRRWFRKGLTVDLAHVLFTGAMVSAGLGFIVGVVVPNVNEVLPASFRSQVAAQPMALQFLEILLLADLGFYALHRAFHAVPALWRFHVIHHSIEQMDWVAAHRVHPIDQILTRGLTVLPAYLLGFEIPAIAAFGILYHWQSLLIHSNVRIDFGRMSWLMASPRFHHWHHANHTDAMNKNFAGQLPLWDIAFRTYYLPDRMPSHYGTDEPVSGSYIGQLSAPLLPEKQQSWRTQT